MDSERYRSARTFREVFEDEMNVGEVFDFDALMDLHDEYFVDAAYKVLFGRAVDPTGLRYYVGRLRRGYSRISILAQLVHSPEADRNWRAIEGLAEALERFRHSRTLAGWRLALNDPELGRTSSRRQARILQNSLGAQQHLLAKTARDVHADVASSMVRLRAGNEGEASEEGRHMPGGPRLSRFQPPRPRSVAEIREEDLPDRIRAAVRLLGI